MERIFLILILTTPLVIIPQMDVGWEVGKVFWFWTIVEAWAWWRVLTRQIKFTGNWSMLTMLIWLGIVLASSILAGGDAFWGGWWRRQGFWYLAHLGLLFWLVSTTTVSSVYFQKLTVYIGLLTISIGVITGGRLAGSVLEPNNLGMLAMIAAILSFQSKSWAALFLAAFGVLLASSRSVLLAGVVTVKFIPKKIIFILGIMAVGILVWTSWLRGGGQRFELWRQTLILWSTKPWLGIGLDNFQVEFTRLMQGKSLTWANYDQPHNLFLWLLVSTGSLGLASFVGWLVVVFNAARGQIWTRIVLAILIFSLFQPLSASIWVYLFVALGLCARQS